MVNGKRETVNVKWYVVHYTLSVLRLYDVGFFAFGAAGLGFVDFDIFSAKGFFQVKNEFIEAWSHKYLDDKFAFGPEELLINPERLLQQSYGSDRIEVFETHGVWCHIGLYEIKFLYSMLLENRLYGLVLGDVLHVGIHIGKRYFYWFDV
jgi:hypothetical protein